MPEKTGKNFTTGVSALFRKLPINRAIFVSTIREIYGVVFCPISEGVPRPAGAAFGPDDGSTDPSAGSRMDRLGDLGILETER